MLSNFEEGSTSDETRTECVGVRLKPSEYQQLTDEAEEYGTGRAALLRRVAKQVRELGDGNVVDGLARLRLASKDVPNGDLPQEE